MTTKKKKKGLWQQASSEDPFRFIKIATQSQTKCMKFNISEP